MPPRASNTKTLTKSVVSHPGLYTSRAVELLRASANTSSDARGR
jgi:hypothetical protein